jgi:pyrimidine operon attenuation protein/uracil phosphoribosyltransferase
MFRKPIIDQELLDVTIKRLCQLIIENHTDKTETVALGMQPRGIYFADRIVKTLQKDFGISLPLGYLDTTFYRDDFRRRDKPKRANTTHVPFVIEDKNVILIDDVLYTGRSVRAALDAMIAYGRARKVELLVLVDRKYSRHLPIEATYTGKKVNTLTSQLVEVDWKEQGHEKDMVWLINKD